MLKSYEAIYENGQVKWVGEVRGRMIAKPKQSIMALEGLGKEIWQGLDAQVYVDQERER
jgi:hypothetical protein